MKVEILQDCKASMDGTTLVDFFEGDVITVSNSFAKTLMDAGYAGMYKEVRVNPPAKTPEKKIPKSIKRHKK